MFSLAVLQCLHACGCVSVRMSLSRSVSHVNVFGCMSVACAALDEQQVSVFVSVRVYMCMYVCMCERRCVCVCVCVCVYVCVCVHVCACVYVYLHAWCLCVFDMRYNVGVCATVFVCMFLLV